MKPVRKHPNVRSNRIQNFNVGFMGRCDYKIPLIARSAWVFDNTVPLQGIVATEMTISAVSIVNDLRTIPCRVPSLVDYIKESLRFIMRGSLVRDTPLPARARVL